MPKQQSIRHKQTIDGNEMRSATAEDQSKTPPATTEDSNQENFRFNMFQMRLRETIKLGQIVDLLQTIRTKPWVAQSKHKQAFS